jgi:hypothetical protein
VCLRSCVESGWDHVVCLDFGNLLESERDPHPELAVQPSTIGGLDEKARVAKKWAIDVYRDAIEEHARSFVDARLQIINDATAPSSDRLRAMEQLESRALGKPKETVLQEQDEPEAMKILRELSDEELEAAIQRTAPPESPSSN